MEEICAGDEVLTRDNGIQRVRWVGRRDLSQAELRCTPQFNPVRIRRGALGHGLPQRDLIVSPQHRMLLVGGAAEMLFGEPEVLAPAQSLINETTIVRHFPAEVTYIHLMFDRHEVICADGAWSESFQPGDLTLAGMDGDQRRELLALFPEAELMGARFAAARLSLKPFEVALLQDMERAAALV